MLGLLLLTGLATSCLAQGAQLTQWQEGLELQQSVQLLQQELTGLRLRSCYVGKMSECYTWQLWSDGRGYWLYKGTQVVKSVNLAQLGLPHIKLQASNKVSFLPGGTPQQYVDITISLAQGRALKRMLQLQPVTGRLVEKNEEK